MKVRNTSSDTRWAPWYRRGAVPIESGEIVEVDADAVGQYVFAPDGVFVEEPESVPSVSDEE